MAKRRRTVSDRQFESSISDITSGLDATVKDLYKAADALKTQIGKDMFDTSEVEQYLDALKDIDKELKSFADNQKLKGFMADFVATIRKTLGSQIGELAEDIDFSKAADEAVKAFKTPFEEMFDNFAEYVKKIPFVGGVIYDRLGIDKIKEKLTENLADAFSEAAVDGVISMEALSMAVTSTFSAMAKVVTGVLKTVFLNPWLLALAAVVAIGAKFVSLQGQAEDFRETTGLTLSQSRELTNEIQKSAMGVRMYGVELEDVYAITGALLERFGNVNLVSAELATDLAKMSKLTGASAENLVGAYGVFRGMEGATDKTAFNMVKTLGSAAHLAGIPINDIMSDVANNAGFVADYMGKSADQLVRTVIESRKLGLGLGEVNKVMDSIMDFESSIEKELQASILIGKQLDFNRARYLAFNGDINAATKDIMDQVGGLQQFNSMNVIQKKALAEALGLTTEELKESLERQKLLAEKGQAWFDEQEMIASELTQIKDLFGQLGASLTAVILPAVEGIAWVLGGIASGLRSVFEWIGGIGGDTDTWWKSLLKVVIAIGAIIAGLYVVKGIMFSFSKLPFLGGAGGAAGGGGFLAGIGKGISSFMSSLGSINPVTLLKAGLALAVIAGTMWLLAKALKEFQGLDWNTLAMAGAALLGLVIAFTIIGAVVFAVGPMILVGALALAVMAGSLFILGKALQEFIPVTGVIEKLASIDPMNLLGVAAGIYAIGVAFGAMGMGLAAAGIGGAIGGFFGGDPITQLERLAGLGPGLMATAAGIEAIRTAMGEGMNLESLNAVPEEINVPTVIGAQISEAIINSNSALGEKLDQVIAAIENQDSDTYLDGRKVNKNLGRVVNPGKHG